MRYRKLDANGDFSFGHNADDFYVDQPEAVGQAIKTRLDMQKGDWFLDTSEGTDWSGKVLGAHTQGTRDGEIRSRVAETQGVQQLRRFDSQFDGDARSYSVQILVDTDYGEASTTVTPQ